jgi:hypothetical protein
MDPRAKPRAAGRLKGVAINVDGTTDDNSWYTNGVLMLSATTCELVSARPPFSVIARYHFSRPHRLLGRSGLPIPYVEGASMEGGTVDQFLGAAVQCAVLE